MQVEKARPVVTPRVRYMNSCYSLYWIADTVGKKPKRFHRIHSSGISHTLESQKVFLQSQRDKM